MSDNPTLQPIQSAEPTFEPVTLAEAKRQLEIATGTTDHDDLLERLIVEAREVVEHDTGLVSVTRTFVEKLDDWPDTWIELKRRPVTSVTSITYVDTSGVTQTWGSTNYTLDTYRVTPAIRCTYGNDWPTIRGDESGITVTYVAGYTTRASIPEAFKQACLLRVAEAFDDRTGQNDPSNVMIGRKSAYERIIARLMRSTYP
jgi:uncharacterized phiE125 gp8 family phage protein